MSADVVELSELLVGHDADLTVRPAHDPVAIRGGVLGLNDAAGHHGDDLDGVAAVLVGLDGGVLVVAVLDLRSDGVCLVELLTCNTVEDFIACVVDRVPWTNEGLGGAPLGVNS